MLMSAQLLCPYTAHLPMMTATHAPDTGAWSRAPSTSYLSLTAPQEAALRAYLDSSQLGFERDERKQ